MASYSLLFIILLLCISNVVNRSLSRKQQIRRFQERLSFHFNPFEKEEMIFYPDVAFQSLDDDATWKVMVHGWRYQIDKKMDFVGIVTTEWVKNMAMNLINADDILYLNGPLDYDRLKPFFFEDIFDNSIAIKIGEKQQSLQTDYQGQLNGQIVVTNDEIQKLKQQQQSDDVITYAATSDHTHEKKGITRLIQPRQGISVISDIDDTIKISEVLDKARLLANTFINPFKPVSGMPELYQQWYIKNNNCTFHYLTGMPDQLYKATQDFINTNNFPDGSFHMRHFAGWATQSIFSFLHSQATFDHKITCLRRFLSNTIRDYVLIGDSGEKDPEIYGTIAREYPARIRAIFIRAIQGEKFDDQRFITAFEGTSQEKWQIFNDPKQLPIDLSRAPRAAAA